MAVDNCIFCKIVQAEIPARKIYERDKVLAILDVGSTCFVGTNEPQPGRVLIIPKQHRETFYDLDDEEACEIFQVAKIVAGKIKRAFNPEFVNVIVRGGRISHTHVIVRAEFKENDPFGLMMKLLEAAFVPKFPDVFLNETWRKIIQA